MNQIYTFVPLSLSRRAEYSPINSPRCKSFKNKKKNSGSVNTQKDVGSSQWIRGKVTVHAKVQFVTEINQFPKIFLWDGKQF